MSLRIQFEDRVNATRGRHADIAGHLASLALLAAGCERCTEFGVRTGNSTTALLYGLAQRKTGGRLTSYDIGDPDIDYDVAAVLPEKVRWVFKKADTRSVFDFDETDMLLVDTRHTYSQVKAELQHAGKVRELIVFHDTAPNANWTTGENGEEGIGRAINEFTADNPQWKQLIHFTHCNGLLVLKRSW